MWSVNDNCSWYLTLNSLEVIDTILLFLRNEVSVTEGYQYDTLANLVGANVLLLIHLKLKLLLTSCTSLSVSDFMLLCNRSFRSLMAFFGWILFFVVIL